MPQSGNWYASPCPGLYVSRAPVGDVTLIRSTARFRCFETVAHSKRPEHMWQAFIPVAVGVAVAVVAAVAAFGIVFAATWSSIHSGATHGGWAEVQMALVTLGAFAAPPAIAG